MREHLFLKEEQEERDVTEADRQKLKSCLPAEQTETEPPLLNPGF